MIRKKGYEMKDYAAWLKAWETYNLHFYSVPAWLSLALVLDLIAGIAFAVARDVAKMEKDTGVNGLSCGTSLDLTDMPADGTYDCRYLDGHGTLHRDATLVVDGTKAGLYNGQGKTMSAD